MDATEQEQRITKLQGFAQELIETASQLQQKINASKTAARKEYYNKKMMKVRKDVQRVLATMELVKIAGERRNAAADPS